MLIVLALSYTKSFKRPDFIPVGQSSENYGTFDQQPVTVDESSPKKKDKQPGFRAFIQRIKILSPYLWPKSSASLQVVALICFILLMAGRVVNLMVPLYLGKLVSALASGRKPWVYLSLFVGLKFMQGSGGILQAMQSILWVPVSQYNDRSKRRPLLLSRSLESDNFFQA